MYSPAINPACFNAEAEGEGDKKTSKNGLANGVNGAHVPERGTSTSNQQMQPTLPPLPEIRPLEPLEPFANIGQSNDVVDSTIPVDNKGDGAVSKS